MHENSHFAMMTTCMIVYYMYAEKNFRNIFFLSILLFSSFIYLSLTFLLGLFFSLIVCILINIFDKNKKNKLFIISLIFTLSIFVFKNDCSKRINYLVKKTIYNLNLLHEINDISKSTEENLSENEEINFEIYNDLLPDRNLSSQVYNIALHNTEYTLK